MLLESAQNPRIKAVVRLQQRSAERRRQGRFCVETTRMATRALDAGLRPVEIYAVEDAMEAGLRGRLVAAGARFYEIAPKLLSKIAYRQNAAGWVVVFEAAAVESGLEGLDETLVVVCSGLEKPGNLGAILRSADGAGAGAVLVDRPALDRYHPNCLRASTGAVFSTPVVCGTPEAILEGLRRGGYRLVAASPEVETAYTDTDLRGKVALVMGAEAEGLSAFWRAATDVEVALPMAGVADSLNVSVAAAILLYEARRQRG